MKSLFVRISFFCVLIILAVVALNLASCKRDNGDDEEATGKIQFNFFHTVDGNEVEFNNLKYTNVAGNQYMITDFQYFVSDVILYKSDGTQIKIDDSKEIHYVDNMIPSTLSWNVGDPLPVGQYDSLSFIFGISEAKNVTGLFVNPPEVNMFWPDVLGGGYHYFKLNGKWIDTTAMEVPFNFHTGIGREITPTDTIFHHSCFRVVLPSSSFQVSADLTTSIGIQMNIESWFKTPHVWDWNIVGGSMMVDWQAMQRGMENGFDVFTRK